MSETLGLKNVNLLSKEQYSEIAEPASDELYAISGSGFGFPSDRYIDLELGASGTTYTAPANGYFYTSKVTGGTNQYIGIYNQTVRTGTRATPNPSGAYTALWLPARKGDVVRVDYTASGSTLYFRFIYAEGE